MSEVRIAAEERTELGKGASRRNRREGKIPAVLYGHGSEPKHLTLPAIEFARAIRENGQNAVLTLDIQGGGKELALAKSIVAHPIKTYIEHVDLLLVRRGEQVVVDVPVVLTGDAAPGTLVNQSLNELQVSAEALHIPEQFEHSVEGLEAGTQIVASDIKLPKGVELQTEADTTVVTVSESPSEAAMAAELDTEGAGVVEEAPEAETEE